MTLGLAAGCSSLDDGLGQEPTTVPETTVAPTTVPETTVAPTTIPETTAAPTTVPETTVPGATSLGTSVPGSTQYPDPALPRTGPSEAAVLAAIGCALVIAGRLALDGLVWLDQWQLARNRKPKPPLAPR